MGFKNSLLSLSSTIFLSVPEHPNRPRSCNIGSQEDRGQCRYEKEKMLSLQGFIHSDPRNRGRQNFCRKPDCRKASKADSQKRWLDKPGNRDYFRGSEHVPAGSALA